MYPARLDDKGRAKLPSTFLKYLADLTETRVFVTSLDRHIGQIYPMAVWRENEKFFQTYRDDPKAMRNIIFNAQDLGAEVDIDSQGRILFSPELRRALEIENQPIRLYANRGRIEVLSEKIYEERKREASASPVEDLDKLDAAGLK